MVVVVEALRVFAVVFVDLTSGTPTYERTRAVKKNVFDIRRKGGGEGTGGIAGGEKIVATVFDALFRILQSQHGPSKQSQLIQSIALPPQKRNAQYNKTRPSQTAANMTASVKESIAVSSINNHAIRAGYYASFFSSYKNREFFSVPKFRVEYSDAALVFHRDCIVVAFGQRSQPVPLLDK